MALTVAKVLETAHGSITLSVKELSKDPLDKEDEIPCMIDNFWLEVVTATQKIASEVAKLVLALTQSPKPTVTIAQNLVNGVEAAWTTLVAAARSSPPKGALIRKELRSAVVQVGGAVASLLQGLKGSDTNGPQLKLTGCVWEACTAIEKLPRDNLAAARASLLQEEELLADALQEIEDQLKCSRFSENEELDNSANWTNQDKELLSPCVGLVRTARASVKKVGEAMRLRGTCTETDGVKQLDRLAAAAGKLGPAVDNFVIVVYPPMNKAAVSAAALSVVTVVREFLELARQSGIIAESDNEWHSFLLRAVDHNNNKVQPLLSPD